MKFKETNKEIISVPKYENCFVYFLLKNKEVVYVGQTRNGIARPYSHKDKDFDEIKILYCKSEDLDITEDIYIEKYNPIYNKRRNYEVVWGLLRVRNNIRKQTQYKKLNLPKLKKVLIELGIIAKKDNYTGNYYITFDEYKKVIKYFKELENNYEIHY